MVPLNPAGPGRINGFFMSIAFRVTVRAAYEVMSLYYIKKLAFAHRRGVEITDDKVDMMTSTIGDF